MTSAGCFLFEVNRYAKSTDAPVQTSGVPRPV